MKFCFFFHDKIRKVGKCEKKENIIVLKMSTNIKCFKGVTYFSSTSGSRLIQSGLTPASSTSTRETGTARISASDKSKRL